MLAENTTMVVVNLLICSLLGYCDVGHWNQTKHVTEQTLDCYMWEAFGEMFMPTAARFIELKETQRRIMLYFSTYFYLRTNI